ncbi:hypothetical protein DS831_08500 [Bombilactobacillus bombi]|uniref:Uncharacterized protein n=1 Tax=Bombilactobacillus bombi TaxID=1303590 RepID=A0A3R6ZXN2_9LACO|nr:hypothetical protein [Bombilactobacillus bombi]RHW50186.1 hypothetical protein DS831_08500 [Bombilactobacillus bombi]
MFDLIINLGTKKFLTPYITKNSIFAYNMQYHDDFILMQFNQPLRLTMASCWHQIAAFQNFLNSSKFYLIYLNLNQDNQKLLISQTNLLPQNVNLYQRDNLRQLLLLTEDAQVLTSVADILHLTITQLNAAVTHYQVAKDD